jgi:hypothetical protein
MYIHIYLYQAASSAAAEKELMHSKSKKGFGTGFEMRVCIVDMSYTLDVPMDNDSYI